MSNESTEPCPLGSDLQRFWDRLSDKERRMDLDREALYSLTPHVVAREIAARAAGRTVVDAFCGAGGMAIGLAMEGKRVTAIDLDAERLDMARRNAALFGVAEKIEFREENCLATLPTLEVDTVVLDPPWGKTPCGRAEEFLLSYFVPDGDALLRLALSRAPNVVMKMPKNFLFSELERFDRPHRIEENHLLGRLLHYCVYFTASEPPRRRTAGL